MVGGTRQDLKFSVLSCEKLLLTRLNSS
uniref:Uncharacterized protein n=1 Tax=Anguilla anguilla TaxID=7936 RepID=A0A0E9R9N4_ANGAN